MRSLTLLASVAVAASLASAHLAPMFPRPIKQRPVGKQVDPGEPLFLSPLIAAGDIDEAKAQAHVSADLPGIPAGTFESYSGFITVNEQTNANTFFWFFLASEVDPATAPVVVWLQGGPGSSSLFGLHELNGPISVVDDEDGNPVGQINPYSWSQRANVIWLDNPVGAGYSFVDAEGLPTSQQDIGDALHSFFTQFFTLFPEYQSNPFIPFGESYGGKFVPTLAKRIHDENVAGAEVQINLAGLGIGNGFMSPPDSSIYADLLYQTGLVNEEVRDEMLDIETTMKEQAAAGQWLACWNTWNQEFGVFLTAMGCDNYYDFTMCGYDPEEDNYAEFVQLDEVRLALHVGDRPFGSQNGDVYYSMLDDFMRSERATVEFLLDNYPTLIYNGNLDIICNHAGVLEMFEAMTSWSDRDQYYSAPTELFASGGDTAGYIKSVGNLRLMSVRNAGHFVPRNQPQAAQDMFHRFIDGDL